MIFSSKENRNRLLVILSCFPESKQAYLKLLQTSICCVSSNTNQFLYLWRLARECVSVKHFPSLKYRFSYLILFLCFFLLACREDVSRLFEFWCEIAPGTGEDNSAPGQIVESFPESFKDAKVTADIPAFAYPCAFER